jgi:hypothetical protein
MDIRIRYILTLAWIAIWLATVALCAYFIVVTLRG